MRTTKESLSSFFRINPNLIEGFIMNVAFGIKGMPIFLYRKICVIAAQ